MSALFLTLGREDNRAVLTCQAEVPGVPGHRQSSLTLDVKCRFSRFCFKSKYQVKQVCFVFCLQSSYIEFSLKFEILTDAPSASIMLGSPLKIGMIEEGHDVYFECRVDANPPADSIQWHHNVKVISCSSSFSFCLAG